nr:sortase [Miniphocaeibacter massiliensis]
MTNPWCTLNYMVVGIETILPNEIDKVKIREGKDMIMLVTCHPYTVNTHRYVVIAERKEEVTQDSIKDFEKTDIINSSNDKINTENILKYTGLVLAIIIIFSLSFKIKKRLSKR